jgi:hypothetical protein
VHGELRGLLGKLEDGFVLFVWHDLRITIDGILGLVGMEITVMNFRVLFCPIFGLAAAEVLSTAVGAAC